METKTKLGIEADPFFIFRNDDFSRIVWGYTSKFSNHLNNTHKHILVKLGIEGPNTVYSLKKEVSKEKLLLLKIHEVFEHRLDDEQVSRAIADLKELSFVKSIANAPHTKGEVIGLSFPGLFWYFIYSGHEGIKERIDAFFKGLENIGFSYNMRKKQLKTVVSKDYYPMFVCKSWALMVKELDRTICLKALIETLQYNHMVSKQLTTIKPIELELEVFIAYSDERAFNAEGSFEKDTMVESFLKKAEAIPLKEAYYCYLLNEDIYRLGRVAEKEFEIAINGLKSVREISSFEGKKIKPYQLFSNEGLAQFFPKNSNIDLFYTGLFINNLLWSIKSDDYDFQI
jgi:hypothetical protein